MVSRSTAPIPDTARTRWIDGAKGIGILLVVYGHAARAIFNGANTPPWAQIADRLIYAFHMPLFFLVAGLFVWPSLGKGRLRFAKDKLATIVYPYFLWSLIEGGLEMVFAGEVNSPISVHDLAMIPVLPIEQFWFLYVLAGCLALSLICYPRRLFIGIIAIAGVMVVDRHGLGGLGLRTLAFFPYLALGILLAGPLLALGRNRPLAAASLIIASLGFAVGIAATGNGVIGGLFVAVMGSLATLALAVLLDAGGLGASLALLGRASLAIYVMHTIFSAGLRIAVHGTELAASAPMLLAATTVAGVIGPLAAWLLADRVGITMLLGFGRSTRRHGRRRGLFNGAAAPRPVNDTRV